MSSTYLRVFLLGLLPLSTLTTAEQKGGAALYDQGQKPFMDRFYMRGSWSKIQNRPSESVEKSLEKASQGDAVMQEAELNSTRLPSEKATMEKVKEVGSEDETEGFPTRAKVAMKNSEKRTPEDKPADCQPSAKMTKQKIEEAKKYKPAGSPPKAKRNDFYNLEDMN